jgi:HEAT repeat protein
MRYEITLYAIAVLTVLVLGAAVLVLLMRFVVDRRRAAAARKRERMTAAIASHLSGVLPLADLARSLGDDREAALDALVRVSGGMPRGERATLLPAYRMFKFADQEIDALQNPHWPRRLAAAGRLGLMGDPDAVLALIETLEDDYLDVRLASARALAQLEAPDAVGPILRALALPGELPSRLAADALLDMGEAAIAPLVEFLRGRHAESDLACVTVAVRVLGERKATAAIPCLIELLEHPDAELRLNAVRALGQIGDLHALEPLCRVATDPVWGVRSNAAQALGRLGDVRALSTLSGRLIDRAWWVRYNAAQALFRLGAAGRERLLDTVAGTDDRYARDISLQILQQHKRSGEHAEARA